MNATRAAFVSSEIPIGTLGVCTPEDRATLIDLYRATYPQATADQVSAYFRDQELNAWIVYRNEEGEILLGLYLQHDGGVMPVARPETCALPEVQHAFLMALREARAVLTKHGFQDLVIDHAGILQPLAGALERSGFLSKEIAVLRKAYFSDSGEFLRRQ